MPRDSPPHTHRARSENLGMLRKAIELLEERPDTVRITVNVERHVLDGEAA